MLLKILLMIHLLALSLSGCGRPESIPAEAAQATLVSAWQVSQHLVWEIEWPAAPLGGSLTVETWRADQRYRFEILEATAPDLVGQTLIFDGQTAWCYNRLTSTPPSSPSPPLLAPVSDAFAIVTKLVSTVPKTATQEAIQLAHGPAQKVTLIFDNGDSLILWQDEATGLPTQLIFKMGEQQATLRARSFEPLLDPPEGLFKP